MPYGLKPRRSVAREVTRIADKQLAQAIERLRAVGDPQHDCAVHEARRHVKKVRALLRLVKPALGDRYHGANRRMRMANRMLAPVADGDGVVRSLTGLPKTYLTQLPAHTRASLRAALAERAARADRKARLDRVVRRVAHSLRVERQLLRDWTLNATGFHAVGPGLEHSYRRARNAMSRAALEPSSENYHTWRRRVKDLWYQVRLLELRCGNVLRPGQRRLEELDGVLGEYHNVVLLEDALMNEGLISRRKTAQALRILRHYQAHLRHRALTMGERVLAVKPRRFVRRIRNLWHSAKLIDRASGKELPWPRAA